MRIQVRGQNIYVEPGRPGNEMDRREMLEFSFSRDWDRYVKFAQFTQHGHTSNVMLMDGRCHVPPEVPACSYFWRQRHSNLAASRFFRIPHHALAHHVRCAPVVRCCSKLRAGSAAAAS